MYDSVNFWLSKEQAGNKDLLAHAEKHFQDITAHHRQDGQVYYSGHLHNYKVKVTEAGISFIGSLAKYYLTDNFHTLNRGDSQRAFEKMADDLHLPIEQAKATRIDFAQNFLMMYEPKAYYFYLGECQHYQRLSQPDSLYYNNSLRTKLFYNKVAQGKAKGLRLPDVLSGQNVLRYEIRFTGRLPYQFNRPEVIASTLYNEKFYMTIFKRWLSEYQAIHKIKNISFNPDQMNSPKDFKKALELYAINMIGQDKIMQMVEDMRLKQAFDKAEYYSRLKKEIRELCYTPDMTTSSELVEELDRKIVTAKQYYR